MKNSVKKMLALAGVAISISVGLYIYLTNPVNSDGKPVEFTVEEGLGAAAISEKLKEEGLIRSTLAFRINAKISDLENKFKAGKYQISSAMSAGEIASTLAKGSQNNNFTTIPEGYTTEQIANLLEEKGIVTRDEFFKEVREGQFDYDFVKDRPLNDSRLDGYLFPETYDFKKGDEAHAVIDRMLQQFEKEYKSITPGKNLPANMSINSIVTVASIVEREAVKADEMPKVASVIYNRLKDNMKLQMCSTVQFARGDNKLMLTEQDIAIDSPYNTYIHEGLPPLPISNPGRTSLKAALEPAETDYLYFVVSEKLDGSMEFTKDYNQFLKDKDAYYKALEKAGKE